MAESSTPVDEDEFCCPICLDLFNDPVTVPCGHSFCMNCIRRCWDREDGAGIYHCPQCQQFYNPRPVLGKNILLADLVEKKKRCGSGSGSVPRLVWCDVCPTGMQLALKSCLRCVASYCKAHLQPHYESAALQMHQLIDNPKDLQKMVCPVHKEPLSVYCRTDQRCVCLLCVMDEHKQHDTVSAVAEHAERQKSLCTAQDNSQKLIQEREKKLQDVKQAVDLLTCTAQTAVEDSDRHFANIISSFRSQQSRLKELIRCEEGAAVAHAKDLQGKLEQETTALKKRDAELQKLAQTQDHIFFLQGWRCLPVLPTLRDVPHVTAEQHLCFASVSKAVSELNNKLVAACQAEVDKVSEEVLRVRKMAALPSRKQRARSLDSRSTTFHRAELQKLRSRVTGSGCGPPAIKVQVLGSSEPRTRGDFLKYACRLTLDPDTAHRKLLLTSHREVTWVKDKQCYQNCLERFDFKCQVLCREALSGSCCYWEAEVKGDKAEIAVTYKGIKRKGGDRASSFGGNDKSWSLECINRVYSVSHNDNVIQLPVPYCSKVGVYLDHSAGTLSFYSVSDKMTLIHKVETTFTEPVYAGFWLGEQCSVKLPVLIHRSEVPHRSVR